MFNTPQEKITELFRLFEGVYGKFDLKQGQQVGYVRRTWEQAFGRYPWDDLLSAFKQFTATSKFGRWPTTGDFSEALKEVGAKNHERDPYATAPQDWKADLAMFGAWYRGIPLVLKEQGFRRDDVLSHFVGPHRGDYAHLCVRAWRLQVASKWDEAVKDYAAYLAMKKDLRADLVRLEGEYFANTHTLSLAQVEARLAQRRAA